jgi:membrane protein DedA with SNARE-associated domain
VTLQNLIQEYGYYVVFAGTFLEGETILIMAGLAAKLGYLQLPFVVLIAFIGSFSGDQLYFHLGRWRGRKILSQYTRLSQQAPKVYKLLQRYDTPLILAIRFLYGLRIVGPIILGMSNISPIKFAILNSVGAALWASVIAVLGFSLGYAVELLVHDLRVYETILLVCIAVVGFAVWFTHWLRARS